MIGLIQRVSEASVVVNDQCVALISQGILALIGIEKKDTEEEALRLVERILDYRIFSDQNGKMNLNLKQVQGGLLLVPQFTLVAQTHKGTRPSFSSCKPPAEAMLLFESIVNQAKILYPTVQSGIFGADMKVSLCNDGPVTFWLNT